jgi:hypothetical protein
MLTSLNPLKDPSLGNAGNGQSCSSVRDLSPAGNASSWFRLLPARPSAGRSCKRGKFFTEELPMTGKKEAYPKIKESFITAGYEYFDGDSEIKGKTNQHRRKPDYIAVKGDLLIIGEIKSPKEQPSSASWRKKQTNDSAAFAKVRQDIQDLEDAGMLDPQVGGHGIVIRGQIPDYVSNLGITYDSPVAGQGSTVKGGYTVPTQQARNVEAALSNCGKIKYQILNSGNGMVTYIFEL